MQLPKPEKLNYIQKKTANIATIKFEGMKKKKEKRVGVGELTGVEGGNGGVVAEVAILFGDSVFAEIIVESVRRRILHIGRVEAGSSSVDCSAIGSAGAAGPLIFCL